MNYFATAKDAVLIAALIFCIWSIYHWGQNSVTKKDLQLEQAQLHANIQLQARWAQEARDANETREHEMAELTHRIAAHTEPVIVRVPSGGGVLPKDPAPAVGADSPRTDVDVRAGINAFELRFEDVLSQCRSALAQWPRN